MGPGERNFSVVTVLGVITVTVPHRQGTDNRRPNSVSKQTAFSEKSALERKERPSYSKNQGVLELVLGDWKSYLEQIWTNLRGCGWESRTESC